MRRFSYFHLTALLLFWHALGIAVADPDQVPIEAKLVHALQAARVKVGDPVLAKVQVKWQGAECSLREGAIVRGHVLGQAARSKTQMSEIAVLFDAAECDGSEMKALPMTLAALMAGDPASDPNAYEPMALGASISGEFKTGRWIETLPAPSTSRQARFVPPELPNRTIVIRLRP